MGPGNKVGPGNNVGPENEVGPENTVGPGNKVGVGNKVGPNFSPSYAQIRINRTLTYTNTHMQIACNQLDVVQVHIVRTSVLIAANKPSVVRNPLGNPHEGTIARAI